MIDLPLARYRLEFKVKRPLHLPAYAGSTLRGAWGMALRSASCITHRPDCTGCPMLHSTCPYAAIFEPRPPAGAATAPSLQDFSQIPRPYVIEPPALGERDYASGETLHFHLVLIGRALAHLPLILLAFVRAFEKGVGRGDGSATLQRVLHIGNTESTVLEGQHGQLAPHPQHIPEPDSQTSQRVRLHFHSPLRLQTNGQRASASEHTARKLLMALVRRTALLHEFHGSGPLALDFGELAQRAEGIASQTQLHWHETPRYSSRQQRGIDLGGVLGTWSLQGELGPFLPYLHLGQWLHVGKEATFGLGGYQLQHQP